MIVYLICLLFNIELLSCFGGPFARDIWIKYTRWDECGERQSSQASESSLPTVGLEQSPRDLRHDEQAHASGGSEDTHGYWPTLDKVFHHNERRRIEESLVRNSAQKTEGKVQHPKPGRERAEDETRGREKPAKSRSGAKSQSMYEPGNGRAEKVAAGDVKRTNPSCK